MRKKKLYNLILLCTFVVVETVTGTWQFPRVSFTQTTNDSWNLSWQEPQHANTDITEAPQTVIYVLSWRRAVEEPWTSASMTSNHMVVVDGVQNVTSLFLHIAAVSRNGFLTDISLKYPEDVSYGKYSLKIITQRKNNYVDMPILIMSTLVG